MSISSHGAPTCQRGNQGDIGPQLRMRMVMTVSQLLHPRTRPGAAGAGSTGTTYVDGCAESYRILPAMSTWLRSGQASTGSGRGSGCALRYEGRNGLKTVEHHVGADLGPAPKNMRLACTTDATEPSVSAINAVSVFSDPAPRRLQPLPRSIDTSRIAGRRSPGG